MSRYDPQSDIVIIGGGIAGMVAAYRILQREPTLNVIVIEAEAEIGGRVLSIPMTVSNNQMSTFDLGGQWISSTQNHIIDLVNELNLQLQPQYTRGNKIADMDPAGFEIYKNPHPNVGSLLSQTEFFNYISKVDNLSQSSKFGDVLRTSNNKKLDAMTMDTYIASTVSSSTARNTIRTIIKTACVTTKSTVIRINLGLSGLDTSNMSALYYFAFCNSSLGCSSQYLATDGGAREFWIKGGAQQICTKLASRINRKFVITNECVRHINHNSNEIKLTTNSNKTYRCSHLIIAIPPTKVQKIQFVPPICNDLPIITNNQNAGRIAKFVVTYDQAFWRDRGFSGEIISHEGPILLAYDVTYNNHPTITGLTRTPSPPGEASTGQPLQAYVLTQLAHYWGVEALHPISYFDKIWDNIYTLPATYASSNRYLQMPQFERIYWAGAETATYWNGYMNGAVQSGHRAAIEILYDVRPQSISWEDFEYLEPERHFKKRITSLSDYFHILKTYTLICCCLYGFFKFLRWKRFS